MTLRIDCVADAVPARIVLHGWLSAAEVPELERTVAEAGLPLRIDLGQLVGVDAEGLRALQRQRGRGACLTNASPYIELLIGGPAGGPESGPEK